MPVLEDCRRETDPTVRELELIYRLEAQGDGGGPEPVAHEEGDSPPPRQWPLVPAALVAAAIGALLTYLGMLTQIWANMAGSQLPGA